MSCLFGKRKNNSNGAIIRIFDGIKCWKKVIKITLFILTIWLLIFIQRTFLWKLKLNDSIHHMITILSTQCSNKVYCALSDGSLALFETTEDHPKDVFYVNFSKSPITFIEFVQSDTSFECFLWLATTNIIIEINERFKNIFYFLNWYSGILRRSKWPPLRQMILSLFY